MQSGHRYLYVPVSRQCPSVTSSALPYYWNWRRFKQVCFLWSIQQLALCILQLFWHSVAYVSCTSGSRKLVDSPLYKVLQNYVLVLKRIPHLPWRCGLKRVMASSFLRFLDHTQRRITVGRTPLDALSVRHRDLYLTHNTHDRYPCPRWDLNPQSQQTSYRRPTP